MNTQSCKKHLLGQTSKDLLARLAELGHPAYRVDQLRKWLFANRAGCFEEMTNLPKNLIADLEAEFQIWSTTIVKQSRAEDETEKLLLELKDGGRIECVLLREGDRRTICISTQVGCAMGCVFCASGLDGVERNLTSGEIVEQILLLQKLLPTQERLSHIVVMGMGEPLANLDSLLAALDDAADNKTLNISPRRITISTVGLPPAIIQLAEQGARYQLAVSLHAANDLLRNKIVPVNRNIGLQAIVSATDRYFEITGRRPTYEYVLLAGMNDQPRHADELVALLRGRPALLNVIPYNPVAGLPYQTPSPAAIKRFRKILEDNGLVVKFRKRKGDKIDAACGQLRRWASQTSPTATLLNPPLEPNQG